MRGQGAELPCGVWGNAPTVPRVTIPKEKSSPTPWSQAAKRPCALTKKCFGKSQETWECIRRSPEGDRRLRLFPLPSGTRGKDQYHRKRQPHPLRPIVRAGDFLFSPNDKKTPLTLANQGLIGIRQRLILPGRVQPSTFSTGELNFCVRDGNRWNLSVITTGKRLVFTNDCILSRFYCAVKRG